MLATEVCAEVRFRDPALIPFVSLGTCMLAALHLALRMGLLMPVFLPLLLLSHVLTLLRLLHLAFVLLAFRMPISTLRLLRRPPLILRSHFVAIPALRRFIATLVRPCLLLRLCMFLRSSLFLAILGLPTLRPLVVMFVLRNSHYGHTQQEASTNPAHD